MNYRFALLVRYGAQALTAAVLAFAVARAFGAPQSVEDELKKTYKLTQLQSDSTGLAVTEPGTVLVIKKGGIRSYPPGDAVVLPNSYKDGTLKTAAAKTLGGIGRLGGHFGIPQQANQQDNSRLLPTDEKVYFTKITVDPQKDIVHVNVIECDTCNNVQQPSNFKAQVDFQFPKGYISGGADAGQIADVIAQVFANQTDNGGADANAQGGQQGGDQSQQGGQQGGQSAAPAAPAQPAQPPPTIQLGQTPDEVIAIMGQPDKIVDLKTKQIYVYKDLKVTFVKGKVSDVE
ncbi:MAG: hypothetical protein WBE13_08825 [Candidatus Acidiferrum sp.]